MGERRSLTGSLIIQFFVQGKRTLHHDLCNLIVLDAFDLGVLGELGELGELGASRFPGPKWVRAKEAKG